MSIWASIGNGFASVLQAIVATGDTVAKVAKTAGVQTLEVGSVKINISDLAKELDTLSKVNFAQTFAPVDFQSARKFLLSQQFDSDIVALADLLGLVGLVLPPVAVASNYVRYAAVAIAGVQAAIRIGETLNIFGDLVPDGRGGFVTKAWAANPRLQLNPDGTFKDP